MKGGGIESLKNNNSEKIKEGLKSKFEEIIKNLNEKYSNIYEKKVGVVEGYTLKEHTEMVVHQFLKYYDYFKKGLNEKVLTDEEFLKMLILHDIGKVSEEVQELKRKGAEKKEWKKEEEKQTRILAGEILKEYFGFDENKKELVLELVGDGAAKIGSFVTGWETVDRMKEYIVRKFKYFKERGLAFKNPLEFFNLLKIYFICDASAYTVSVVKDFKLKLGERTGKILDLYKTKVSDIEESTKVGAGVTEWFEQNSNEIKFVNNNKFGDHKMEDWINELERELRKISGEN